MMVKIFTVSNCNSIQEALLSVDMLHVILLVQRIESATGILLEIRLKGLAVMSLLKEISNGVKTIYNKANPLLHQK